ncbi:hypothetical protein ACIQC0_02220 [Pseudarthrobacter sp. NPDC092419]|uniref:hypothetical protein n=1 Tax=Pseudarthrobacter sp. NPDC092419 TaxID=3364414 RepID=UPI0037FDAE5E
MDKHVVIMDGDDERSPFDIQDQRAIKYGLMPDEIEEAVQQLRAKAASAGLPSAFKDMMNPVASAFQRWTTHQRMESEKGTPEQLILQVVERLETKIESIDRRPVPQKSLQTATEVEASSMLGFLEDQMQAGKLRTSLRPFLAVGSQTIGSGDSLKLREWMQDAMYVIKQAENGKYVDFDDLPSQLF